MERVHYRRVVDRSSPARRREEGEAGGGFKEKLTAQAIVAALALVAVMSVCYLDFNFTQSARAGLRQALSGETTPEGLFAQIKALGADWFGTAETQARPLPVSLPQSSAPPAVPDAASQPAVALPPAVIGEESKIPVPELPAYPEPQEIPR